MVHIRVTCLLVTWDLLTQLCCFSPHLTVLFVCVCVTFQHLSSNRSSLFLRLHLHDHHSHRKCSSVFYNNVCSYRWTGVTCFRGAMLRHFPCRTPTVKTSFVFYMSYHVIYSEFTGRFVCLSAHSVWSCWNRSETTPLSFVFSDCISDWLRRPSECFALFKRLAGKIASYNLLSGTLNPSLLQQVTVVSTQMSKIGCV